MTQALNANSQRLQSLMTDLRGTMDPVKGKRLGGSDDTQRFVVLDGKLGLAPKIQGCWDKFVEFIVRIFCAIFGITREIQSTFEQITDKLKEALTLGGDIKGPALDPNAAPVDPSEAKIDDAIMKEYKAFIGDAEYKAVVEDMFKASAKLDKIASCCMGGKAYSMEKVRGEEGKAVKQALRLEFNTPMAVKDSEKYKAMEEVFTAIESKWPKEGMRARGTLSISMGGELVFKEPFQADLDRSGKLPVSYQKFAQTAKEIVGQRLVDDDHPQALKADKKPVEVSFSMVSLSKEGVGESFSALHVQRKGAEAFDSETSLKTKADLSAGDVNDALAEMGSSFQVGITREMKKPGMLASLFGYKPQEQTMLGSFMITNRGAV